MRVVCREWSESELPFQSPEVPSVSVSASRARSFQEGDFQAESVVALNYPVGRDLQ